MDKPLSVHEKKATKQAKTKKKPVKVVYISNPMKVKTTASEFRALVQELTGQDSSLPSPPPAAAETYKYSDSDSVGSHQRVPPDHEIKNTSSDDHSLGVPRLPESEPDSDEVLPKSSDLTFDSYDDAFMPQMLENFPGLLSSSSNLLSQEFPHDDVLKSLDAV